MGEKCCDVETNELVYTIGGFYVCAILVKIDQEMRP